VAVTQLQPAQVEVDIRRRHRVAAVVVVMHRRHMLVAADTLVAHTSKWIAAETGGLQVRQAAEHTSSAAFALGEKRSAFSRAGPHLEKWYRQRAAVKCP
jgi:Cys-tRNA synthase (O-phospho-L-seryl-tRNA:Cys-tRNA synthase)